MQLKPSCNLKVDQELLRVQVDYSVHFSSTVFVEPRSPSLHLAMLINRLKAVNISWTEAGWSRQPRAWTTFISHFFRALIRVRGLN